MQQIKTQATAYLPKEFIDIENKFLDLCEKRTDDFCRMGMCDSILNNNEFNKYETNWEKLLFRKEKFMNRQCPKKLRTR